MKRSSCLVYRKPFKVFLSLALAGGMLPAVSLEALQPQQALAAESTTNQSGTVSEGWTEFGTCEWQVDSEGALTIRPLGNAASGTLGNPEWEGDWWSGGYVFPWGNDTSIKSLKVQRGVQAGTSLSGFCSGLENLVSADFSGLSTLGVTNMAQMFSGCSNLPALDLSSFNTASVTDMSNMFASCSRLVSINISSFDTSSAEYMYGMFYKCEKLKSVDLSHFNTSKVTSTRLMFYGCASITSIDASSFDTSNMTNMSGMFGDFMYGPTVLESITIGDKFVFAMDSDGTRQEPFPDLPSGEYTGKWISSIDGKSYEANEIPNNVAATYTAVKYPVSSVTGVSLGPGLVAVREETINQVGAKEEALAEIKYWRQDALDDTSIKFHYYGADANNSEWLTTREYLAKIGMTEEEYLSPTWSNVAERLAIQRGIEAGGHYDLVHTRPNGNSGGESVLAWGSGSPAGAIDMWASEKSAYVQHVQDGQDHGETGHYLWVIWPDSSSFGVGGGGAWAGVSGSSDDDDSATNLSGTFECEVAISDDKVAEGITWSGADSIAVGNSEKYAANLNWDSRYSVKGTWVSSNPEVASVDDNGTVKGLSVGQTTLTVTASTGAEYSKTIEVTEAAPEPTPTPTPAPDPEPTPTPTPTPEPTPTPDPTPTPEPTPTPAPEPTPAAPDAVAGADITRLSGESRYDTMQDIVDTEAKQGAIPTIYLTSGQKFPDALASAGLAGIDEGVIALTTPDSLSTQAEAAIKAAGTGVKVVIVGGDATVSSAVADQVKVLVGEANVSRVSGASRTDTAVELYRAATGKWGKTAVIASGFNSADSLSVSSYAYAQNAPIFLAEENGTLSDATRAAIAEGGFTNVVVVGGIRWISDEVVSSLGATRIAGENRYETSAKIAEAGIAAGMSTAGMVIASGEEGKYPDALAGGSLAGRYNAVMLLVSNDNANNNFAASFFAQHEVYASQTYLLGGEGTLSADTATYLKGLMK